MNKYDIKIVLFILFFPPILLSAHVASGGRPPADENKRKGPLETEQDHGDDRPGAPVPQGYPSAGTVPASGQQGLNGWVRTNPITSGALGSTAAFAVAGRIAYEKNAKFRVFADRQAYEAKFYLLRSVVLPTAIKVEEIKADGLSRTDVLKGALIALGCYGVKKVGDYLHLWQGLRTRDFRNTRKVLASCGTTLYNHKKKVIALMVGSLAVGWLWKFSHAVNQQAELPLLDQFLLSLSDEQRIGIMQSPRMSKLISDAADDPQLLQQEEDFMYLLTDDQKKKLDEVVEDYIEQNDPLAFLERDLFLSER